MPSTGPWEICYTPPGLEQVCTEFGVPLWPTDIDSPDPAILDQLQRLQEAVAQMTDQTLQIQLAQVLDTAVRRFGDRLPAGFEFRRAATHDLEDGSLDPFTVPDVTYLGAVAGVTALMWAGYAVKQENREVGPDSEDVFVILEQSPAGGTPYDPPMLVTVWVGWVPPIFNPGPPQTPVKIPPFGVGP
jgi:hypothetical protein